MSTPPPVSHQPLDDPKGIAVFICGCRGAVSSKIPLEFLSEEALTARSVRSVEVMSECCGQEDMDRMRLSLSDDEIDRFVVAGCSWRTSKERFRRVAEEAGKDPSLVEICNIKEHCALVHERKEALAKTKRLLQISLARVAGLQAVPTRTIISPSKNMVIVGNGHSATIAAKEALTMGLTVLLACPNDVVLSGHDPDAIGLEEESITSMASGSEGRLILSTDSSLIGLKGAPGAFRAILETPLGETEMEAGAILLAIDEEPAVNPLKVRFGEKAITQEELEGRLNAGRKMPRHVVMLAMDEEGASDLDPITTHEAVHNALFLRTLSPSSQVYIITREVVALGQCEAGYRRAQEVGARVVRTDSFPRVEEDVIVVRDVHLEEHLALPYDILVVDNFTKLPDLGGLARIIGLPLTGEGRLRRPNAKLKPSASLREGVFVCGTAAERNLGIGPTLEARSAVAAISAMLSSPINIEVELAEIWPDLCSACLTCVRTCPYSAPYIGSEGKAEIDQDRCQGCGTCVGICPSKAIQMYSFRDDQISETIRLALGERQ